MPLSDSQVKALSEMEEAAHRLERAHKELNEAQTAYDQKRDRARRVAPLIFGIQYTSED